MKKNTAKAFLTILLIFSNISTFAQDANPNDPPADADTAAAPIDSYSYFLILLAVFLSFYFLNKVNRKKQINID